MKPSRTYSIAAMGIVALVLLLVPLVVALFLPERIGHVDTILDIIGRIVLALAGVASVGAGAVGIRHFGAAEKSSYQEAAGPNNPLIPGKP